jgi:hypothetical protein
LQTEEEKLTLCGARQELRAVGLETQAERDGPTASGEGVLEHGQIGLAIYHLDFLATNGH